jgi:hypothetical protein
MVTFDMLPKCIRELLANSNHNWSCEEAFDALTFDVDEDYLIGRIKQLDAKLAEEHYAHLATGLPFPA